VHPQVQWHGLNRPVSLTRIHKVENRFGTSRWPEGVAIMAKQAIHREPHRRNLLPLRQADKSSGTDGRSNNPIVSRWAACPTKARVRSDAIGEIYDGQLSGAPEARLARPNRAETVATLEFGRFRVLLRRRQLIAPGVPVELGTRALDLLLVLLEADGSLVSKDELFSRVWPDIFVSEENLKVQICALRKALGDDRDFIRTEFGRGYRFTGTVRSIVAGNACHGPTRRMRRSS
jgi:DNA-binding winged helix-turn-helix (wHTH) protein